MCVAQYVRPTFLGWLVIFAPILVGTGILIIAMVKDLFLFFWSQPLEFLVDLSDAVVFVT